MEKSRKYLFALIHSGLASDESFSAAKFAPLFGDVENRPDWNAIYKLSAAQGVLAVAWDGLQRLIDAGVIAEDMRPSRSEMLQWVYNVQTIEDKYHRQKEVIGRLAKLYSSAGIDMMVLKGYGLSLCYPVPEHRPCGDIDIWLYGCQKQADDLLRNRGIKVDEDVHHHTVFHLAGIMIENHFDFLNVHAHVSNRGLEKILQEQVKVEHESVPVGEGRVKLPPANFNALFLLRHSASHFAAEKIGLRHLTDWALFVERYGDEIDWTWLERVAREYNMHRFLYCLQYAAAECSGMDIRRFHDFGVDKLAGRVLNDVLFPEFSEQKPAGFIKLNIYKCRRWWANRWKHNIVYRESLFATFFQQLYSHLLKPKTFTH